MSERVDLQEFVGGFIAESDELVAAATAGLLEIDEAAANGELRPRTVRDVFRAMHTIKGLAGMMGIEPIVAIAHVFETVLRTADKAGGQLGRRAVELGLVAVRAIAERVKAVAERKPVPAAPGPLIDELARVDAGAAAPRAALVSTAWDRKLGEAERRQVSAAIEGGRIVYSLSFTPSATHSSRGITIATVRAELAKIADIIKVLPRALPASPEAPAGLVFDLLVISDADPSELAAAVATTTPDQVVVVAAQAPAPMPELAQLDEVVPVGRSSVRVELARLDELQEQLSALVVSRFRLERAVSALAQRGHDVRALQEIAELQRRQLRDLRRGILRARMVRVAEVLEPLWLLVRSLVKPDIKEARLEIDVRDAELDKAVADRLLPAIVHLVRNALDHAIEPVVDRERAGKPRVGRVRISSRDGTSNQLELRIEDDGRGIDREKIASRTGTSLADDDALLEVLATPGFSTRDVASETSGRGLGMDIVKRTVVGELGGELSLETQLGVGTVFTLRVPLTIAIVDVFSFECANRSFVVPVSTVEEIFDIGDQVRVDGPTPEAGRLPVRLCERRGRAMPVVDLGAMLRISGGGATKALVVRRGNETIAFAVDRMLGRHEVVVRPIEDVLGRAPGIAGATDLGDGRPTLLLDLVELGGGIERWRREAS